MTDDTDYSQFGEQPIILDFLKTTDRPHTRFCVDAGAFDGSEGSNSRALFELGWDGLAIEPNPRSFSRLKTLHADRPGVICLQRALSSQRQSAVPMKFCIGPVGTPEEHQWQYGQVSTFSESFAAHYEKNHEWTYETQPVDVDTLTNVMRAYAVPRDLGFLSIDCEGEDLKILEELDMAAFRPLLVCLESEDANRHIFAQIIEPRGYAFHAKTRSNTFYVRTGPV